MPRDNTPSQQNIYNPVLPSQIVTVGAASVATTNTVNANAVLLCSTTNCWIAFGTSPTAVKPTIFYLPANVVMALQCDPSHKVAAIQDTAGGSLIVTGLNCP